MSAHHINFSGNRIYSNSLREKSSKKIIARQSVSKHFAEIGVQSERNSSADELQLSRKYLIFNIVVVFWPESGKGHFSDKHLDKMGAFEVIGGVSLRKTKHCRRFSFVSCPRASKATVRLVGTWWWARRHGWWGQRCRTHFAAANSRSGTVAGRSFWRH